jgi:hypothetical protein
MATRDQLIGAMRLAADDGNDDAIIELGQLLDNNQYDDYVAPPEGILGALGTGARNLWDAGSTTLDLYQGDAESILARPDVARTPEAEAFSQSLSERMADDTDYGPDIFDKNFFSRAGEAAANIGGAIYDQPKGALHMGMEQVPYMAGVLGSAKLGSMAGAAAGAPFGAVGAVPGAIVGGLAGAALGMFAGNTVLETGFYGKEFAADDVLTDEEMSLAKEKGIIKGGVVTAFDLASLGLARFSSGLSSRAAEQAMSNFLRSKGVDVTSEAARAAALKSPVLAKEVGEVGAEAFAKASTRPIRLAQGVGNMTTETLSEASGELFGEMAAGEEGNLTEAMLEGIMAFPMSVTELQVAKRLVGAGPITKQLGASKAARLNDDIRKREQELRIMREEGIKDAALAEDQRKMSREEYLNGSIDQFKTEEIAAPQAEDPAEDARQQARNFSAVLGIHFPTDTNFSVATKTEQVEDENGNIKDVEVPQPYVVDSAGRQYGPQTTPERAAMLAGALNEKALNRQIDERVELMINSDNKSRSRRMRTALQNIGRRFFNPNDKTAFEFTPEQIDTAAPATETSGLSPQEVLDAGIPRSQQTPSQRLGVNRLRAGEQPKSTYSVEEVRSVLGKNLGSLADTLNALPPTATYVAGTSKEDGPVIRVREYDGTLSEEIDGRPPTAEEIESGEFKSTDLVKFESMAEAQKVAAEYNSNKAGAFVPEEAIFDVYEEAVGYIEKALKDKNITSSIDSPEFRALAEIYTGIKARGPKTLRKMSGADRRLLYQRLRQLPQLPRPDSLPLLREPRYNLRQRSEAIKHIDENTKMPDRAEIEARVGSEVSEEAYRDLKKDLSGILESAQEAVANTPLLEAPPQTVTTINNKLRKVMKGYGLENIGAYLIDKLKKVSQDSSGNLIFEQSDYMEGTRDKSGNLYVKRDEDGNAILDDNGNPIPAPLIQEGGYYPDVDKIFLSLDAITNGNLEMTPEEIEAKVLEILDHEILHALREADLFTEKEWTILRETASRVKKDNGQTYSEWARTNYGDMDADTQAEESVAEMVRDALQGKLQNLSGRPRTLMRRIVEFFKRFFGFQIETGEPTAKAIIESIRSGEIGGRERGVVRTNLLAGREAARQGAPAGVMDEAYINTRFSDKGNIMFSRAITLSNIEGALDKDKTVLVDGVPMGTILRGWLRNGGEQWVYHGPLGSSFGHKSIKGLVAKLEFILKQREKASQQESFSRNGEVTALGSVDKETLMDIATLTPNVHENKTLLNYFAKAAGYKNADEYNAAIREDDAAFDALLRDPSQLKAALLLEGADKTAFEKVHGNIKGVIHAAIVQQRELKYLRDRDLVKQLKDAIYDMSNSELNEAIDQEFDLGTAQERMSRRGMRVVGDNAKQESFSGPSFSRAQTKSPEFKKWFGKSSVLDENGNPLVVYHGTNADISEYSKAKGGSKTGAKSARMGFFFTNNPSTANGYVEHFAPWDKGVRSALNKATGNYAEKGWHGYLNALGMEAPSAFTGGNVQPVYLRMENPLVYDMEGKPYREAAYADIIEVAKEGLHDGVIIRNTHDSANYNDQQEGSQLSDIYIVFQPNQIKSAVGNTGAFSVDNDNVMFSRAAKFTDKRVKDLVREYGYTNGRVVAAVASVSPKDFIAATAVNPQEIYDEAETLDEIRLAEESQPPFLRITSEGKIDGHEGRHRMAALASAGVERVPVVIYNREAVPYENKTLGLKDGDTLQGQTLETGRYTTGEGQPIKIYNPIDIKKTNTSIEEMSAEYGRGQGDDVRFSRAPTRDSMGFYSAAEKAVLDMNLPAFNPSKKNPEGAANGTEIFNKLRATEGVKKEELFWLDVENYLTKTEKKKFTREEVADYIANGGIQLEEVLATDTPPVDDDLRFEMTSDIMNVGRRVTRWASKRFPFLQIVRADDEEYRVIENPKSLGVDDIDKLPIHRTISIAPSLSEAFVRATAHARRIRLIGDNNSATRARWGSYIMDGDHENYRELKIIYPQGRTTSTPFKYDAHFDDDDVLGFLRVTDREAGIDRPRRFIHYPALEYFYDEVSIDQAQSLMDAGERVYAASPDVRGRYDVKPIGTLRPAQSFFDQDPKLGFYTLKDTIPLTQGDLLKLYFIEELQSDWLSEARKNYGFADSAPYNDILLKEKRRKLSEAIESTKDALEQDIARTDWDTKRRALSLPIELDVSPRYLVRNLVEWATPSGNLTDLSREEKADITEALEQLPDIAAFIPRIKAVAKQEMELFASQFGPPLAPFAGDGVWEAFAMKRAILDAISNGRNAVSWPNAASMEERWSEGFDYGPQYDRRMVKLAEKILGEKAVEVDDDYQVLPPVMPIPDYYKLVETDSYGGAGGPSYTFTIHGRPGGTGREWRSKEAAEKAMNRAVNGDRLGSWVVRIPEDKAFEIEHFGLTRFARRSAPIGSTGRPYQAVRPNKVKGGEDRVQTSLPSRERNSLPYAVKGAPEDYSIGIDRILTDPAVAEKHKKTIEGYDFFTPSRNDLSALETIEEFKQFMVKNLIWLHNQMDPEIREIARKWYDGARKNIDIWSDRYNLEPRQVAAIIANLSPQKDWFMNMSLAERVMDIYTYRRNVVADADMDKAFDRTVLHNDKGKLIIRSKEPRKNESKKVKQTRIYLALWEAIKDAPLSKVESLVAKEEAALAQAIWVRMYDEAHHSRHYRMMKPTGEIVGIAMGKKGPASIAWGSFSEIAKGMRVLKDGSLESVSLSLGGAHKVRNFYNNLISPNSNLGEVTIDTHAMAAAVFKPLSAKGYEVSHVFGGTPTKGVIGIPAGVKRAGAGSSDTNGIGGIYGIVADAYREAAAQLGLLPRELQSITWEEIRVIYPVKFKDKEGVNLSKINALWKQYAEGKMTLTQVRKAAYGLTKNDRKTTGNAPKWASRPDSKRNAPQGNGTYTRDVYADGLRGQVRGRGKGVAGRPRSGGKPASRASARGKLDTGVAFSRRSDPFQDTPYAQALAKFGPEGMTLEARMARAEAMGFDTSRVWYHGTRSATEAGYAPDIKDFQTTKYGAAEGVFLTPDPKDANRYASSPIYPGGTIYPVHTRGNIGSRQDMLDADGVNSTEKTASMMEKGFDGYFDEVHGEMVMFDPSNIRSVNATFDPDKSDSGNILFSRSQTNTPEFKSWFGKSKVIDENGNPQEVYHGSSEPDENEDPISRFAGLDSWTKGGSAIGNSMSGLGDWFTDAPATASYFAERGRGGGFEVGPAVYPVYLRMNNPLYVDTYDDLQDLYQESDAGDLGEYAESLQADGYDGIIIEDSDTDTYERRRDFVTFNDKQVKSIYNRGSYDDSGNILFSRGTGRTYSPEVLRAKEIGQFRHPTRSEAYAAKADRIKHRWKTRLRQNLVDQFASFSDVLEDPKVWMMAHLSGAGVGTVEAVIEYGLPYLHQDGVIQIDTSKKSFKEALMPLGEEVDDWAQWVAGLRSRELMRDGKEHLFDEPAIDALISLAEGEMADGRNRETVYKRALKDYKRLGDAITKIGVETGLINQAEAAEWVADGAYLPFYRVLSDEDTRGPNVFGAGGLVKQFGQKKIKGADLAISDPIENILMNWNHLVSASLKNQAAKKALGDAVRMGIARRVTADNHSKKAVYIRVNGKPVWYELDGAGNPTSTLASADQDQRRRDGELVLDSLVALNSAGLNGPALKIMRSFKRALTTGVTASPEFKFRNLIRDSIQAIAVANMSPAIQKNLLQGWALTGDPESKAQMLASGALFGDSGYIHGADPDAIRYLVSKGVHRDTILDSRQLFKKMWNGWQDFGSRLENVNRAANYEQALTEGRSLLEASFESRDHLDFNRTGSMPTIRYLSQIVPFLNARQAGKGCKRPQTEGTVHCRGWYICSGVYRFVSGHA